MILDGIVGLTIIAERIALWVIVYHFASKFW
jgi:hypothetical protein